jgi:hypothetical protein
MYWDNVSHHVDYDQNWMAHPLVRAAINQRVSGDPNVWPVTALHRRLGTPAGPCLSIGCGLGGLERSLIEEGISRDVTGIDISDSVEAGAGDHCLLPPAGAHAQAASDPCANQPRGPDRSDRLEQHRSCDRASISNRGMPRLRRQSAGDALSEPSQAARLRSLDRTAHRVGWAGDAAATELLDSGDRGA